MGYSYFHNSESLSWHHHEYYEICFVEEGEVAWEYEGDSLVLTGNEISVTPPGLIHRGHENAIRPCRLYWLQLDGNLAGLGLLAHERERLEAALSRAPGKWPSSTDRAPILAGIFAALERNDTIAARGSFLQFLALLIEDLTCFQGYSEESGNIGQVLQYIDDHLRTEISVKSIARKLGHTPSYFSEVFRSKTGFLPKHYILKSRIHQAKQMLRESDESITDIAMNLCFSSSQHFANTFRKYTGMTPSSWRRSARCGNGRT